MESRCGLLLQKVGLKMETENKMTLPEKLLALRKGKNLTQLDVAEELDVSRQAVSRWESGAVVPGTDKLKALSDLYGVSIDFLLNDAAIISRQTQDSGSSISEPAARKNPSVAWPYAALIAMTIIAAMAIILLIHSRNQNQSRDIPKGIPIEDLSTSTQGEDESVGTFLLE